MKQNATWIIRTLVLVWSLCAILNQTHAASFYWVGGTGTWTDLSHWATSSGGSTNHIIVPTPLDDVIFDANSFPVTGGTVTLSFEAFSKSFTVTPGLSANVTFQFDAGLNIADYLSATPNNALVWNQSNKLECVNNVTFGLVNFTMSSGYFHITTGDLILQNGAYFKKQGWTDNTFLDDGTVTLVSGATYEQTDGYFTAGNGNISVPAGATFINSAHNKILKEGGFSVASGATATIDRQWQIYDGGYDVNPGATYNKPGGALYMYAEHSGGPYYIRNAGKDIHRIQFESNYGVEYHLLEKLQALNDGVFIYANKFMSDGFDIDAYHFYSWTGDVVTINLTGTDTVKVRSQYRLYPSGSNLTYSAPDNIVWTGTDHTYFIGGNKAHNDLWFNCDNMGSTIVQFENIGTVRDVVVNANGQQYMEMYGPGSFRNFAFNHNNAGVGAYNPLLRLHGNNSFTGTFQTNSAGANIRPILDFQASNTFNVLDLNNLLEWVMNAGTTQITTDLKPINGACGKTVLVHSASPGSQVTLQQASGAVTVDWVLMQDIKAQGAATFTATNTVDLGNNTGWTIVPVPAQTLYWVNGNGNWSDPAHWSLSSGGAPGCSIPTRIDNVVFDANSFTGSGQYCSIDIPTAECKNMSWAGTTAGAGIANSQTLNIYGNLICASGMSWAHNGYVQFQNTALATITTNGVTINSVFNFYGQNQSGSNFQLLDNFKSNREVFLHYGNFKSNGFNLDVHTFNCADQAVSVDLTGSTEVKLIRQWRINSGTSLTIPFGCHILFESTDHMYFESWGQNTSSRKTYGNVTFNNNNTGGTEILMQGGYNNFNVVTVNHGGTYRFYNGEQTTDMDTLLVNFTQNISVQPYVQIHASGLKTNYLGVNGTALNHPALETVYTGTYGNAEFNNLYSWQNWSGYTRNFNNLTVNGSCSPKTLIYSASPGTQAAISVSGVAVANNCILQDINAVGAGAFSSSSSAIAANVSGWPAGSGANYYWIGGTGDWNDPNHWSLVSGGAPSGCIPTRVDNVFFDINSFNAGGQIVTIQHNMECRNMVWNNVNNPVVSGSDVLNIFGSLILAPNLSWNHYNWVFFQSRTNGNTINTNGVPLHYVIFNGEGTYAGEWTLQGDFKATDYIYFRSGHFYTNGYSLEAKALWNDYNDNRIKIDFSGTPEVKVYNQVHFYPEPTIIANNTDFRFFQQQDGAFRFYNFGKTVKNVIMEPGASSGNIEFIESGIYNDITINSTAWPTIYFHAAGTYNDININFNNNTVNIPQVQFNSSNTINNLSVTSTGNGGPYVYLHQNNTFNSLIAAGLGTRLYLGAGRTQSVNGVLALGNGSFPVLFQSTSSGTQGMIYKTSGTVCLDFVVMSDIKAEGGATFYAGASSVNIINNTNWIFNSCGGYYWVGDNGNWSDYAHHWATSSGGSNFHGSVPSLNDNVYFDANSFTTAGRTVTVDVPVAYAHDMKWGSALFNPGFTGTGVIELSGDLELISAMNQNYSGEWNFTAPDNGHIINTAGKTLNNLRFSGGSSGQGEWTLANPLQVTNDIHFENGALITANKNITAKNFYSTTANIRSLQLGSSTITIQQGEWNTATLTDADLAEGTSTIVISGDNPSGTSAFKGNSLTYNNLTFTTASSLNSQLTGSNTFNMLRVDPGLNLSVAAGATQTMSDFIANGDCSNFITIQSATPGTPSIFTKASGTVDATFLTLRDITATGGATWNADFSNDLGNNPGWNFSAPTTLSIQTASTSVDCQSNNDGTASVTSVSGGVMPYTYEWSTTETTASIANLIPGTYTVTVTDAADCSAIAMVQVVNDASLITPVPFSVSASQVCLGTAINFTAGVPAQPVSAYLWNFGDFTTSTQQDPAQTYAAGGTYTVTLSYYDTNGCPATTTASVTVSNPVQNVSKTDVGCFGAGNGTITVLAGGGISPYQFSKDNGSTWQNGNSFSGLVPDVYPVITQDAIGCFSGTSVQIIDQPASALSASFTQVNPSACGATDGSITISGSGGTPPYQYSINGGIVFVPADNFSSLANGIYTVVVRDANLCVTPDQTVNLSAPDAIAPLISCAGPVSVNTVGCAVTASVTVPGPSSSDNCGSVSNTNDFNGTAFANGTYPIGVTQVLWTATDAAGNTATCLQNVTVTGSDMTPPGIGCPMNISAPATGPGGAVVNYTAPVGTDNCPGASTAQTSGLASGATFPIGTTINTFTVTAANGQTTSCSFSVTVFDPAAALHFDGTNDNVSIPGIANLQLDNFTLESWFNPSTSANFPALPSALIAKGSGGFPDYFIATGSSSRKLTVGFYSGASFVGATSTTDLAQNTWYHVAGTFDGTTLKIYINGVLESSVPAGGLHPRVTANALSLGLTNAVQYLNGALDEVRVWNIARSCEEIRQYRNCELAGSEPGLVSYYKFNQGTAGGNNAGVTTLIDAAGGDNNGTLSNFGLNGATSNWVSPGGVVTGTNCPASITYPEADVKGNGVPIADGAAPAIAGNHTDFGQTTGAPIVRTFTIENTGTAVLNVSAITLSGANAAMFAVSSISLPANIAAAGSATFNVTYTPTGTGVHNATVNIASNDCDEAAYDFAIKGEQNCAPAAFTACPTNLTVNTDAGVCTAVVNYTATASGTPAPTLSYAFSGATAGSDGGTGSGSTFNPGNTVVTVTATNPCSTPTCQFTVTVNPCVEISGTIFWKGDGMAGVNNAVVMLSGEAAHTDNTDTNGDFDLIANTGDDFVITPTKNTGGMLNGVTAADATVIQQHLTGYSLITDFYRLVAADCNRSNNVSSVDAGLIRQALLGNPQAMNILNTTGAWRFVRTGYTPVLAGPYTLDNYTLFHNRVLTSASGMQVGQDFYGIKTGDVFEETNPGVDIANPSLKPDPDAKPLVWRVRDRLLKTGQTIELDFSVVNFTDIAAFQNGMRFDPVVLQYQQASGTNTELPLDESSHFGTYQISKGELRTLWSVSEGKTLPGVQLMYRLQFKVLQGGKKLSEVLGLDPAVLPALAYTTDLAQREVQLLFTDYVQPGLNRPDVLAGDYFDLLQNRPNPFSERTTIGFILPMACDAQLRVFDISGRELWRTDKAYSAGYHEETLRLDEIGATGMLFYELTTPQGKQTRKMMALKL